MVSEQHWMLRKCWDSQSCHSRPISTNGRRPQEQSYLQLRSFCACCKVKEALKTNKYRQGENGRDQKMSQQSDESRARCRKMERRSTVEQHRSVYLPSVIFISACSNHRYKYPWVVVFFFFPDSISSRFLSRQITMEFLLECNVFHHVMHLSANQEVRFGAWDQTAKCRSSI